MTGTLIGIGFLVLLYIGYLHSRIEQENKIAHSYADLIIELNKKCEEQKLLIAQLKEKINKNNKNSTSDFEDILF